MRKGDADAVGYYVLNALEAEAKSDANLTNNMWVSYYQESGEYAQKKKQKMCT